MKKMRMLIVSILFITLAIAIVPISLAVTWSEEFRLTTLSCFDGLPCIAQTDDGRIWVAWQSDILGNSDIIYRIYNESSWTELNLLTTNDTNNDISPSMFQAENGTIWVFLSNDGAGNYDVYYKTSSDGGSSWSNKTQLTTHLNDDNAPSAMQAQDGTIWVVWHRKFPGPTGPTYDLFCKTNDGSSWSEETQLTFTSALDEMPSIAQMADGRIWVAWCSNETGDFEIFYKVHNGTSWSNAIQLTTSSNTDVDPSLAQDEDGTIWAVWASSKPTGGATDDLYYMTSSNNGVNWSESVQLTTDREQDTWGSISHISGKGMCVVWASDRYENYDIFYKVSWTSDFAVLSVSPSITAVAQGKKVLISVEVKNEGMVNETFTVTAYCNNTIPIGTQTVTNLYPSTTTTLTFTWDTTLFPPANYIISANTSQVFGESDLADNSQTDGTVQVKIPGDVDGDRDVDIVDLSLIARALGTDPTWPHGTDWDEWNPQCDLNDDLKVDVFDLTIAGKNYGMIV